MADILGFLRAAIQPTVQARSGYLQGQEIARQRDIATRRQSLLDQIKAAVDASEINRNDATADRMNRGEDAVVPVVGDDGTVTYMPRIRAGGQKVPPKPTAAPTTGKKEGTVNLLTGNIEDVFSDGSRKVVRRATPEEMANARRTNGGGRSGSGSGASQDRMNAKTALDEAIKQMPRPSKTPQYIANPDVINAKPGTDIKDLPFRIRNPAYDQVVKDSTDYEQNTISPLRQRLYDATKSPTPPAGPVSSPDDSSSTTGSAADTSTPKLSATQQAAMESDYATAAQKYQTLLAGGVDSVRAKAAYDKAIGGIAQKYGVTSNGQP